MLMRTKIQREFFPIFIYPKNLNRYLIIPEHFVKNLVMFWSVICFINTTIGFFIVIDCKTDVPRPRENLKRVGERFAVDLALIINSWLSLADLSRAHWF